jgi:hypothetical protein
MSEILATNKDLKKIIDNAVKRIGENHSMARDDKGFTATNEDIEKERATTINSALKEAADEIAQKMVLENTIDGMAKKVIHEQRPHELSYEEMQDLKLIKACVKTIPQLKYVEKGHSGNMGGNPFGEFLFHLKNSFDLRVKGMPHAKEVEYKIKKCFVGTVFENVGRDLDLSTTVKSKLERLIRSYGSAVANPIASDALMDRAVKEQEEVTESLSKKIDAMAKNVIQEENEKTLNESTRNTIKKLVKKKLSEAKGWSKNAMPGYEKYMEVDKDNSKINKEYAKEFKKKFDDYADFEGNRKPEFPQTENERSSKGYEKYENTTEDQEFVDDFAYPGLQDFDVHNQDMGRLSDYLEGNSETGNAQKDDKGEALGNVVPSELGKKILKSKKRRKEKIDQQQASKSNLRGYTPDVQKVKQVKEDVKSDITDMKKLWDYNKKTQ